jgi:hypothetical protein
MNKDPEIVAEEIAQAVSRKRLAKANSQSGNRGSNPRSGIALWSQMHP